MRLRPATPRSRRLLRLAGGMLLGIGFAAGLAIAQFSRPAEDPHWAADEALRARVDRSIALHHALHPFDIAVEVDDQVARLSGSVDNPVERELAGRLAGSVDGVREVDNRLILEPDRARWLGQHSAMVSAAGDDRSLALAVRSQLRWHRTTRALPVRVDSIDGQVRLRGTAPTLRERDAAGRVAARIDGVQAVDNRIEVARPAVVRRFGGFGDRMADTWLTAKVKSALLLTSEVGGLDLRVHTDQGEVRLTGIAASRAELELAVEIVAAVRGVRRVDSSRVVVSHATMHSLDSRRRHGQGPAPDRKARRG
jgi:osmotically-inducible protein OsmY